MLEGTAERAPDGVPAGAYVLVDEDGDGLDLVLVGTGSEVSLCVDARELLAADGLVGAGGVDAVVGALRRAARRLPRRGAAARRARRSRSRRAPRFGWDRYADDVVGIDHFGASAPGAVALEKFGFTAENVAARAARAARERRHSMTAARSPG